MSFTGKDLIKYEKTMKGLDSTSYKFKIVTRLKDYLAETYTQDNIKRAEMLFRCGVIGKEIDKSYYNLNDINDCVLYILDADQVYWGGEGYIDYPPVDECHEDYYISYHYKNIPQSIEIDELFWKKLFKFSDSITDMWMGDFEDILLGYIDCFKDDIFKELIWIFDLAQKTECGNLCLDDGSRFLSKNRLDEEQVNKIRMIIESKTHQDYLLNNFNETYHGLLKNIT